MKLRLFTTVVIAVMVCMCVAGCGDERSGDIENPVAKTRRFITALSNGSVRCDAVCKDIALRVRALADASAKRQLAEEWENAFFSYPVESLSYREQASCFLSMYDAMRIHLLPALQEVGCGNEKLWDTRIRFVHWLKSQASRLRPSDYRSDDDENRRQWTAYEQASTRLGIVAVHLEDLAIDETTDCDWMSDVRNEFQNVMGRKMRNKAQIEPRWIYLRELKGRIDKEKLSCFAR